MTELDKSFQVDDATKMEFVNRVLAVKGVRQIVEIDKGKGLEFCLAVPDFDEGKLLPDTIYYLDRLADDFIVHNEQLLSLAERSTLYCESDFNKLSEMWATEANSEVNVGSCWTLEPGRILA